MKLAHIALRTNDLDAAAFWRDYFSAAIGALYRSRRQQGFTSRFTPASLRLGDILFVNAGILTDEDHTVLEVTTESFNRLMVINALSPLRTLEVLQDLVPERRTIAVISSGLGSIAENADGVWDAYSASKAALNMLMRGVASRHARKRRAIVLMAPGWVRTAMGGPEADLEIDESIPGVVDTVTARIGKPGLRFLDYTGRAVAW